jgi:hypothetical protein
MTQIKINKMLESAGGNFITLERIANDKTAVAEIRLTALTVLDKKYNAYPERKKYHKPERENHRFVEYRKNSLNK